MVSSTSYVKAIASILSLVTITNAHMIMRTPIPYGKSTINSSPLNADGSDYPCKGLTTMDNPSTDTNYLVPGVPNTLDFTGSAVHGGGSCQVSLTTDLAPTKSSKWMVIKSIEGGCPANVAGNLPANPQGTDASTFQYTVPEGFPSGEYTIAWTWFNKIGNREMYMNCGRANIGAAKKRYAPAAPKPKIQHRAADYPDILKAQLSIFTCTIPEGTNVAYPSPGPDVQVVAPATTLCGGDDNAAATGGSGSGAASSVATSAAGAATSAAAGVGTQSSAASVATLQTGNPGVFASGAASQSAAATTAVATTAAANTGAATTGAATTAVVPSEAATSQSTSVVTATLQPVPAQSSAAPVASTTPSSSSSTGNGSTSSTGSNVAGTTCSQEGAWACASDGKSFQRCASGMWSVSMQVATGTSCTPGTSMTLNMSSKRDLFSHLHFSPHRRGIDFSS